METELPQRLPSSRSGSLEIDGAGLSAGVILEVVAEALILVQGAHAGLLNSGDMDESVVSTAAVRHDEAKTFVDIEEFYGADRHSLFL